jgi:hypothetical protein
MEISKIIRKVLLEDDSLQKNKTVKGLDYDDQVTLLQGVQDNCTTLPSLKNRTIKELDKQNWIYFPELESKGLERAVYIATQPTEGQGDYYVVFGVKDDKAPQTALLSYRIFPGSLASRVKEGLGSQCEQLKALEDLGIAPLGEKDKATLQEFVDNSGGVYVMFDPKNPSQYEQVFYKDLKYTSTGQPVLPKYNGDGYLWRKVNLKQQTQDKISQIESMLSSQSFTTKEPEDLESDENKYSFYFKDIKNDWPGLTSQAGVGRDNDVIYPMNEILYPDKKTCRTTIKKLYNCITSDTARDCGVDLFKNKFIALRCESPKIGGIFGLEDEFDRIKLNGGPYGVANLRRAVGKAKYGDIKESSIEKKINIFLNEELKKFRF